MPMCIGSFSLNSKWIGLAKRYPNSSVLRRDVESDRLIGNMPYLYANYAYKKLFIYINNIAILPPLTDLQQLISAVIQARVIHNH